MAVFVVVWQHCESGAPDPDDHEGVWKRPFTSLYLLYSRARYVSFVCYCGGRCHRALMLYYRGSWWLLPLLCIHRDTIVSDVNTERNWIDGMVWSPQLDFELILFSLNKENQRKVSWGLHTMLMYLIVLILCCGASGLVVRASDWYQDSEGL